MPANGGRPDPHKKLAILARRRRVAAAYLDGKAQWEIAAMEEVTQATVSNDLAAVRKDWAASGMMDFHERVVLELAKIDRTERAAREAYARSCKVRRKRSRKKVVGGKNDGAVETTETREQAVGDPAFLEIALSCVDRRCRLLRLLPGGITLSITPPSTSPGRQPVTVEGTVEQVPGGEVMQRLEFFGALYDRMAAAQEAAGPTPDGDGGGEPLDTGTGQATDEPEAGPLPEL